MFALTRQDTSVMKGIAICAMLCHHLYACPISESVMPYHGIMEWIGVFGKVCVALFLFCSGYGLSVNYTPISIMNDVQFIARRLVKFYANYWVIFVIFVPISVLVFHRSFSIPYGEDAILPISLLSDVLGLQGAKSYNITWGFNQLIIVLYLLFPILYRLIQRIPWVTMIVIMAAIHFENYYPSPMDEFVIWKFPFALAFVMGIIWNKYENALPKLSSWLSEHQIIFGIVSVMMLITMILLRMNHIIPQWTDINMDAFLSCATALVVISVIRWIPYVKDAFVFLGKHSMNIYMIHTFFNAYWHPEWLHTGEWLRGGANFAILLLMCLGVSVAGEYSKEKMGLYKLVQNIVGRI